MAITSAQEIWRGETFTDDQTGKRTYERIFQVISNDPSETAAAVRAATPGPGSVHPDDPEAFARRRRARRDSHSRLLWEVTVPYETADEEFEPNPLDRPPKIRWSSGELIVAAVDDIEGKAIVNAAGDYFDPPPEDEETVWQINVEANVSAPPAEILDLRGAKNDGPIVVDGITILEGKAKLAAIQISELKNENDVSFRTLQFTLEVTKRGWDLHLLNQGFREKVDGELREIMIEDEDGNEHRASAPVLLDGEGRKLADPNPDNAVFLDFVRREPKDLTILPGITGTS